MYMTDTHPFICEVNGYYDKDEFYDIEQRLVDQQNEYFEKGDGIYGFNGSWFIDEQGSAEYTHEVCYWELELVSFESIEEHLKGYGIT